MLPATNTIIWRWDLGQTAFGDHAAQNNPDGDAANYVFNLRYPGQYFDSETALHYNYFRDYDPSTGRYVQSDPIGLNGGMSTFAYAANAPLSYVDPTGEVAFLVPVAIIGGKMLWGAAQEAAWQHWVEGKPWGCINWAQVSISAGFELIPGASTVRTIKKSTEAFRASRNLSRQAAAARTPARVAKLEGRAHQRAVDGAQTVGEYGWYKAGESLFHGIFGDDSNPPKEESCESQCQ